MKFLRTPDQRFDRLPDFPFSPRYLEVPGENGPALRMHYVDEGPRDAPPVLMLHGEPTWCFLYRKIIPIVQASGLRAVAPDLIGFGRSDKPALRTDYTYQRHVDWVVSFIEQLDLRNMTLLCQDWGGLIGLRIVAEHPERFARVIAANTALPTGDHPMPEGFYTWLRRSQEIAEFTTGKIVRAGCKRPFAPHLLAAYDAPFPDESYQAGARQFPMLVPLAPSDPAAAANRRAWESLSRFTAPFLTVFGDGDPYTQGAERALQRHVPGAARQRHRILKNVGHFLQEDVGEELGRITVAFANEDLAAS